MNQPIHFLSDEKLAQIATGQLWSFHGGVHPAENKIQSNQTPIRDAGIPKELIIAVEQKGYVPELLVKEGDIVLKGQPLTKVYGALVVQHASSSGKVKAIEPRTDCHPSGLPVLSVVIETDGLDRIFPYHGFDNYQQEQPATLINAIQDAGIIGLGGAGFATHLKLAHQANRLLIINAVECEPYITSDDRLIQEHADEIIQGIQILQHILQPKLTIFAIEDNMPEAIDAFTRSLQLLPEDEQKKILVKIVPTRYPSGSAKQLIELLTGEQTPIGKHSSELGITMQNVGTAYAIKEAIINGKPLVSRIVTITGDTFARKGNARVRIGTPIQYLLDTYWFNGLEQQKLIIGGPMMGFTINDPNTPVTKICNCLLAPTQEESPAPEAEMSCIRCSECAEACPVELLPQQLLWYAQSEDHKKLEEYDLSACIECGACAYVCPSHIPLVEYYRVAKAQIKTAKEEANKAAIARKRHEDRELRLEREKQQRQLKHKLAAEKRKQQMKESNQGEDLVAAALARAKAKKAATANDTSKNNSTQNPAVAAAIARAKAKKAAAANSDTSTVNKQQDKMEGQTSNSNQDPKKAAVAAAIARAKAKKETASNNNTSTVNKPQDKTKSTPSNSSQDPKKAAVAAAIARAKAKKAAASNNDTLTVNKQQDEVEAQASNSNQDPKKAAIAAAIAKAKAKKSTVTHIDAPLNELTQPDNSDVIKQRAMRKEKARLHKQQSSNETQPLSISKTEKIAEKSTIETKKADERKAKIAAVIEKAKAKKQDKKD